MYINPEDWKDLKKSIDEFHGGQVSEKVVFFANPCTMQIILSHFNKVFLKSNSKKDNAPIIKKLIGIDEYKAMKQQRESIMKKINTENYKKMKKNIYELSTNYNESPSTNIYELFLALENGDVEWVKRINEEINNIE